MEAEEKVNLKLLFISGDAELPPNIKAKLFQEFEEVKSITPCSPDKMSLVDAEFDVLISFSSVELLPFIKEIRSKLMNPIIPFVWITPKDSALAKEAADIYYSLEKNELLVHELLQKSAEIAKKIGVFQQSEGRHYTPLEMDKINILRYMVSREISTVSPSIHECSRYGYDFPALSTIVRSDIFPVLSDMESEEMLRGEFVDIINVCKTCGSSHIALRETCPKCGSTDIKIEDYIHHFRCGYLGPESDYIVPGSDKLVCPKCGRELRHIGVDYDKPSKVYVCNNCGNVFEKPSYSYLCFNCGEIFKLEDAKKFVIKRYTITKLGESMAVNGSVFDMYLQNAAKTDSRFLPYSVFKIMLEHEKKKARRYGTKSCLITLKLVSEEIPTLRLYEITKDMMGVLKLNLRETDIVSMFDDCIFILLPETPCDKATVLQERIQKKTEMFAEVQNGKAEFVFEHCEV